MVAMRQGETDADRRDDRRGWPRRAGKALLLAGIAICGVNLFTGGPLLALWLGSQVQNERMGTSTEAVAVVLVAILVIEVGLTRLLRVLSNRYDALVGQPPARRRQSAWLRSASGERRTGAPGGRPAAPSEKLFVFIVVAVMVALEVWFFFFARLNLLAPSSFLG